MAVRVIAYKKIPELIEKIAPKDEMLLLLPTQKKTHFVKNQLLGYLKSPGVFSIADLLYHQYQKKGGTKKKITPVQQLLIMERIIEENWNYFQYFSEAEAFPGLAAKVKSLFNTLVQERKEVNQIGGNPEKIQDLLLVLEKYRGFLKEKDLIDSDILSEKGPELVGDLNTEWKTLGLDTLNFFTPQDWHIIQEMEDGFAEKVLFSDLPQILPDGKTFYSRLKAFNGKRLTFSEKEKNKCGGVEYYFNQEEEVRAVGRALRRKIESGVSPASLFVVPADLDDYQQVIREIFPQYDLPFDISRGLPLEESPPAMILKTILDLVSNPFSRQLLYRFFSSSLVELKGLDIETVDYFARRFNFNDLEPLFKDEIEPGSLLSSEEKPQMVEKQLQVLNGFIERFFVPLKKTDDFPRFFQLLREIFLEVRFLENVIKQGEKDYGLHSQEITIALNKLFEVLDQAEQLFEERIVLEGELQERARHVLDRLLAEKEYYIPAQAGGIQVTEILNMRGWPADTIFFLGVTADNFPKAAARNFLLPGRDSSKELQEARLFFYQLVSSCREIKISFPAFFQGRETQPSPLVKRFLPVNKVSLGDRGGLNCLNEMLTWLAQNPDPEEWKKYASPRDLRTLVMEKSRERKKINEYSGNIGAGFDLTPDPIAVTALQDYWRCPFYYFLKWVLGIEKLEEVEEEEELALFGLHVHQILQEFGEQGGFEILEDDFAGACILMKEISHRVLEEEKIDLDRNLFIGAQYNNWLRGLSNEEGPEGVFLRFLKQEKERMEQFKPREFETDLGKGNQYPRLGPFNLKGRIDRLDFFAGKNLMIYDYKTGRVPGKKEVETWKNLQLPLYVLAMENRPDVEASKVVGGFYQLRHREEPALKPLIGDYEGGSISKKSIISLEKLGGREKYEEILTEIKEGIDGGNFPTTDWEREEANCDYCSFRTICRKTPIREEGEKNG